jgi:hypothetical protein
VSSPRCGRRRPTGSSRSTAGSRHRRATSRARSSAGWQPRWIVRHLSPGTQHTASHSPTLSIVAMAAPAGRASARRRPLFSWWTSSRPAPS